MCDALLSVWRLESLLLWKSRRNLPWLWLSVRNFTNHLAHPPPRTQNRPPPVLVMAHGIGAQKDVGLAAYGAAFAKHAIAVVLFDYRTFGGSDGEPRHWVSVKRHLEDYEAVISHIKVRGRIGVVW
jgi:pimeloyl-ACP methyl ester carboxylesterase